MQKMTRRAALTAIPAMGVAAAVPAMAEPVEPDLYELADYHARELVKLMDMLHPHKKYRYRLDHEHGYALICGDLKSA